MSQSELDKYLYSLNEFKFDYSLGRMKRALKVIGNPQNHFDVIHIAGSNGKGSVAGYLTSVLVVHGYKVGLYTSPHIKSVRERIQLGTPNCKRGTKDLASNFEFRISSCKKELFESEGNKLRKILKRNAIKLTYFEFLTVLAFVIFKKEKVRIAVVEAGLGGRYDATNMVYKRKLLNIITSISKEHTEYLGDTLLKILKEKAEIIGDGKCVTGIKDKNLVAYLKKRFKKQIIFSRDVYKILKNEATQGKLEVAIKHMKSGLLLELDTVMPEKIQAENIRVVLTALEELTCKGYNLELAKTLKGLSKTEVVGRLTKNKKGHYISIAHNAEGIDKMLSSITSMHGGKKITYLFSCLADKDMSAIFRKASKHPKLQFVITKINNERGADPEKMQRYLEKYGLKYYIEDNNLKALALAQQKSKGGVLVIGGSFYLVSKYI